MMEKRPNILTIHGYWKRYQEVYNDFRTDKEIWIFLENELMDKFGITRYTAFDSFRRSKSHHFKKRRKATDLMK